MKVKGKKSCTIRIPEKAADWYSEMFSSHTMGLQMLGNGFPSLFKLTLHKELRGYFEEDELSQIIVSFDKKNFQKKYEASRMGVYIEDELIENGYEKLSKKVSHLTLFQRAVLELWAISLHDVKSKKTHIEKML